MALTAEQYKALREALVSAFPNDDYLEMMLEDEVSPPLSIPSADDYCLRVFKLVKSAGAEGRLRELVIGASRAKPGNPELKCFVQKNLQALLEVDSNVLATELLSSLIQCLNSIADFAGGILSACIQTLPDLDVNHPILRKQLLNNNLSTDVKWLILLELFLKTYGKNAEGDLYIILFIKNLRCSNTLAFTPNELALTNWLNHLPIELQPAKTTPEQVASPSRPSNEVLRNLQAYFLITVDYPEITTQTGKFVIKGYVISRVGNDNELTEFKNISLQSPADKTSTQTSDVAQNEEGLECTILEIEDCLPGWLLQAQEVIDNRCTELRIEFSLALPPVYDLTIEFWLPFDHLVAAADAWKVYGGPVRRNRPTLAIGQKYRVLVRSYDRFIDPGALNELNRTWQNLNGFLQTSPDTEPIQPRFEHVDCWERLTAIQQQFMNQSFLGLTLTCPLCLEQYQEQRKELFYWILEEGIPIALWSRCSDLADLQQKMHELLTANTLCQLDLLEDQLLEQIKKTRKSAKFANDEQHLGHHLAIWFDEPKRLIELKQFLKPGRLSA